MAAFRYTFNALVYYGERIEQSVERLARMGYDGIEVVGEPEQYDAGAVARQAADAGIRVSSVCSIYAGEDRDLSHPLDSRRQKAVDYSRAVADFTAELGADVFVVAPAPVGKMHPTESAEREWQLAVESIREVGAYAASVGVQFAIEPWNRYETYAINKAEDALMLWRATGLDHGGVWADLFHMNIEEERPVHEALRALDDALVHLHVADSTRAAPGVGHIDFEPTLRVLDELGYGGWISVELLPASGDPFSVMQAGGHHAFFDEYTELAITTMKQVEATVRG